jgi:hypothetical protein
MSARCLAGVHAGPARGPREPSSSVRLEDITGFGSNDVQHLPGKAFQQQAFIVTDHRSATDYDTAQ